MTISIIINVSENVVQIYNDKDVVLFGKDLIDISLEACWCIFQSKKQYLIFKIAISSPKHHILFVRLPDSYLMICIGNVKLDKPLNLF